MRMYRQAHPNSPYMCLGPGSGGHLITGKKVRVGAFLSRMPSAYGISPGQCKLRIFYEAPNSKGFMQVAVRIK